MYVIIAYIIAEIKSYIKNIFKNILPVYTIKVAIPKYNPNFWYSFLSGDWNLGLNINIDAISNNDVRKNINKPF